MVFSICQFGLLQSAGHLSQQAVPSTGWAQQAPPLSSGAVLGVQQAPPDDGLLQHEVGSWATARVIVLFCNAGMFNV